MMSKSTVPVAIDCCRRGVVVGLREVDPVDLGAGIGLPRLQEAAEQDVVQVLVVEAHEGQLDAGELAFLDVRLGGAEAQFADLLPVGIGGLALADAGDLQDLGAQIVLRRGPARVKRAESAAGGGRERGHRWPRPSATRAGCACAAIEPLVVTALSLYYPPRTSVPILGARRRLDARRCRSDRVFKRLPLWSIDVRESIASKAAARSNQACVNDGQACERWATDLAPAPTMLGFTAARGARWRRVTVQSACRKSFGTVQVLHESASRSRTASSSCWSARRAAASRRCSG